ncbi:hypothetical protein Tco_0858001 [Tanacetum coccineum]|uniref:Uncharacterized protein n=1 Tax=Tanacetum coccineum TaxID=301880 RepID=A0ABQ5BDJ8_9ASTR
MSEPFEDPIENEDHQSLPISSTPIPSPNYRPATLHTDKESEPMEASETRVASPHSTTSPLDSILLLSPDHPLPAQTSLTLHLLKLSTTAVLHKRYRGTSEPILDTETEGDESEAKGTGSKSEESEDKGLGLKSKEVASKDQQQQAVLVEDTTADEPLSLGYGETRRCALEIAKDIAHSTYEVGQSSRSIPVQQIADETTTLRLPVRTTWEDPVDGTVYTDIKCIMPLVRPPIPTPASPEWSSDSLPISPASLIVPLPIATPASGEPVDEGYLAEIGAQLELYGGIIHDHTYRLDALLPTLLEGMGWDITELYNRSAVVRDDIYS